MANDNEVALKLLIYLQHYHRVPTGDGVFKLRASNYESGGHGFESCRARHLFQILTTLLCTVRYLLGDR